MNDWPWHTQTHLDLYIPFDVTIWNSSFSLYPLKLMTSSPLFNHIGQLEIDLSNYNLYSHEPCIEYLSYDYCICLMNTGAIVIGYCINTTFYDWGHVSDTLPSLRGNVFPRHERGHKMLYLYNNHIIYPYKINRNHADTYERNNFNCI